MSEAVVWSENGGPFYAGSLELTDRWMLLCGTAREARESRQKLLYDEVADVFVERKPEARLRGRTTLVAYGGTARASASSRSKASARSRSSPIALPRPARGGSLDWLPRRDDDGDHQTDGDRQ